MYEKELEELRQQVNDNSTDFSVIEELNSTVLGLESKLAFSYSKILYFKE